MKTPEQKYLFIPGLAAAIVFTAATSSFVPQREQAGASGTRSAQYCTPENDARVDAPEIYC